MITERNSVKTEFSDFLKLQKTLSRTLFIVSLIALITGAAGTLAYIIVGTVLETVNGSSPAWCEALLVFAVPLGFGIVFVLAINSQMKQAKKLKDVSNVYEFFADCVIIREVHSGAEVGVTRADYKKIFKTTQKGQYLLIRFLDRNSALPVDISTLGEEELNTVKKVLSLKLPQDAKVIDLSCADAAEVSLAGSISNNR